MDRRTDLFNLTGRLHDGRTTFPPNSMGTNVCLPMGLREKMSRSYQLQVYHIICIGRYRQRSDPEFFRIFATARHWPQWVTFVFHLLTVGKRHRFPLRRLFVKIAVFRARTDGTEDGTPRRLAFERAIGGRPSYQSARGSDPSKRGAPGSEKQKRPT